MYGIRLYWEIDADGSWFYTIEDVKITGFWCESAAIKAGQHHLKQLEKKKMEELQAELADIDRNIEQLIRAPQHIGELTYDMSSLDSLLERRGKVLELLEYPSEGSDNNFD